MEDDNPFSELGDDLIEQPVVKEKIVKEQTLEDWICRTKAQTLNQWIYKKNQEKLEKFLSYDWTNPSERVKAVLGQYPRHLISTICHKGDPTNGRLLRLLLHNSECLLSDPDHEETSFSSTAARSGVLPAEQFRILLEHPNCSDPFKSSKTQDDESFTSTAYYVVKEDNLPYLLVVLECCKDPNTRLPEVLKYACQTCAQTILQYLVETKGMSVTELIWGRTPLQHAFMCFEAKKRFPTVQYLLLHGADINAKDSNGNTAILYMAYNSTTDETDKLVLSCKPDVRVKTNELALQYGRLRDGMTAFGYASHGLLRLLFEYASNLLQEREFCKSVISDVVLQGDYEAITIMWPYVKEEDVLEFIITPREYTLLDNEKRVLKPIEKLFVDCKAVHEAKPDNEVEMWDSVSNKGMLQSIWRHTLNKFSHDQLETLFNTPTASGSLLQAVVAQYDMLPESFRFSAALQNSSISYDLGLLSTLPREVVRQGVFNRLTFNEATATVSVSKSWFKEITANEIWRKHPHATSVSNNNLFRAVQKNILNEGILKHEKFCYGEIVHVEDGEGMLVVEKGFLHGVKLNGQPIMACWPLFNDSVMRCMARSKILSKEDVNAAVNRIGALKNNHEKLLMCVELYLNAGKLEFSSLVDTLMPFMKCMASGTYWIRVFNGGEEVQLFECDSDVGLDEVICEYPFRKFLYMTQPSDCLDTDRVKYYEKLIEKGERPVILAIDCDTPYVIIDGHHKITAYQNLGRLEDCRMICIQRLGGEITRDEEKVYIEHSRPVKNSYTSCLRGYTRFGW